MNSEDMVEFVSYHGQWPCLCSGTLAIRINGKTYRFNHAMVSGGCIWHDSDWNYEVTHGDWTVDLEEHPELEPYREEITRVVNENVEQGCCGGCI